MTVSEVELREPQQTQTGRKSIITWLIVVGFSIFYFTDVLIRASEKYFWFDEIVTVYMCRLPNLHAVWQALIHGVDYNPPLFYIFTRASKAVLGENLIGMRMPQIIGFWVLCLCLFRFVNRRGGPLAGVIAMLLPIMTGGFYYAYEARAHGITLGFCGLAIVCWQMSLEDPRKRRWLVALSACLLGAFTVHCYALLIVIPFAIVEIKRNIQSRRINWPMWFALVLPAAIAVASYVPLFLAYRSGLGASSFPDQFPPSVTQITSFYDSILWPCITVIVCAVGILAADRVISSRFRSFKQADSSSDAASEILLGAAFLLLPAFGLVLNVVVHGPFFARYYLSAMIGLCMLIGLGVGTRRHRDWLAAVLLVVMGCSAGWQFSALLWHRYHGKGEDLWEPSAGLFLDTTPGDPLAIHKLLLSDAGDSLPIVVPRGLEFIYLTYYSPRLRPRLYYVSVSNGNYDLPGLRNFRKWCPTEYNPERALHEFVSSVPHFLVYADPGFLPEFAKLAQAGGTVKSIKFWNGHFLAEIER